MNSKNLTTFSIRFIVVLLIHYIVKAGDLTFGDFSDFTFRGFVFSIYFISYWLCVWYVASFINNRIQKKQESFSENKKLYALLLFMFHFVFGFLVSFFANYLYRLGDVTLFDMIDIWAIVPIFNPELTLSLFVIYMMIFSSHTYYQSSIKIKEDQLQFEKLKQENTLAQYLNLKSQIEPHFLFNSLSVLSSLIYTDVNLASDFTLRLSRILRYVIEKNEFMLVPLSEEITFVENYLFLIQTRFEKGIIIENAIDKNMINSCYIPPSSLQLLIENSIKHNKFTAEAPLRIKLFNDDESLTVSNNLNIRTDAENSTKQGLDNLIGRYSHFCSKPVEIKQTDSNFTVSIPILTIEHYERFNI